MSKLWVDDEREAPLDWMWAKTIDGAIALLERSRVEHLSLDYSLIKTDGRTTDEIMYWLQDHPDRWPSESIVCHSDSSSAQDLIERMIKDFAPEGWANGS